VEMANKTNQSYTNQFINHTPINQSIHQSYTNQTFIGHQISTKLI